MKPIITVDGLRKNYKIYRRKTGFWGGLSTLLSREYDTLCALDDISFEIQAGDKVAYIGPNGAGKSTTIKILTGIMTPTAGRCEVSGLIPYEMRTANARNIGVVFGQRTQLWWDLPAMDSFSILRRIYDIPQAVYAKNLRLFRDLLAIDEIAHIPVRSLSLGQRMRVEVAASFLHDPRIVFLDEPTVGLDAVLKEVIRGMINQMNKEVGTTVVLTSHDMDDIKEVCDDVILIDKSKIVYKGSLAALHKIDDRRSIIIDCRNLPESPEVIDEISKQLPNVISVSHEGRGRLRIDFHRAGLDTAQLISFLFGRFDVIDFFSLEPDLESVIRQIYLNGLPERMSA